MNNINVMNKNGYIFVIQSNLMDIAKLVERGCTIFPSIEALYKGKCDFLEMETDEAEGCEFSILTSHSGKTVIDDGMCNQWELTINELDWLVEMDGCPQPQIIEDIVAEYQM
ncbi:hypothetical protein [Serratia phage SP1]|nr:hypothetical protein [Serratia phage SP1]